MSETASSPESATGPIETPATTAPASTAPVVVRDRGGRLNVVAAWVGIVAGSVFVVAVIFFSGFVLGASVTGGDHHGGHQHGHGQGQMERDGGGPRHGWPGGPGGPGFPGGPGWDGPGQGPGSPPPTPPGR
ncbi:hypothetical protein D8S82_28230 [Mycobacterium hodleri]|uniref:Proline rich protein n=1 Tax=Mycolicibacterium hodleri TaxID=49897 RepID=A0A544VTA6_9MYCO|nr:hypothetical protein [Mycolicibacterium hodleri]TQR83224.1 hypothetical protein D8S82_28230 [Mycolicibacterium hodleri]